MNRWRLNSVRKCFTEIDSFSVFGIQYWLGFFCTKKHVTIHIFQFEVTVCVYFFILLKVKYTTLSLRKNQNQTHTKSNSISSSSHKNQIAFRELRQNIIVCLITMGTH